MMKKAFIYFSYLFFFFFYSCTIHSQSTPKGSNRLSSLEQKLEEHPFKQRTWWQNRNFKPWQLYSPPTEVIDYLNLANRFQKIPDTARATFINSQTKKDFEIAVSHLPSKLKKMVEQKLLAIFIVENLGSTGLTDYIVEPSGRPKKGFLVFDQSMVGKLGNEWCTDKESSPFRGKKAVRCYLSRKKDDARWKAWLYILLHELGHILNIDNDLIPVWSPTVKKEDLEGSEFLKLSWVMNDRIENRYKNFPQVRYFTSRPLVPASESGEIYEKLAKTNFPTLYASTNPWDDWAESFANYFYTEVLGMPFYLLPSSKKKYRPCWDQLRCREKRKIIEKWYKLPDNHGD